MNRGELLDCYESIAPYLHRTPVLTASSISASLGSDLYFKCENFQKAGAYKIRGATHAVMRLGPKRAKKGVVTHSSGNFAQALTLAAKNLGAKATIVMPSTAPKVKKEAVLAYGGTIVECEPTLAARNAMAEKIRVDTGGSFIHPSNDREVIIGQSTACMELLHDYPDLEVVVVPVGGGGLIAGTALAAQAFGKNCAVIGAEPYAVDDAYRSLQSGRIESNASTDTIADGLKTQLGSVNFPIIKQYVKDIIRVEEGEIVAAMRLIWERMKIIIEPSSAVAVAAVIREASRFKGKKVGIIISGGNVDLEKLPF